MNIFEITEPLKRPLSAFIKDVAASTSDSTAVKALVNLFETTPVDQAGGLINRVNELLRMYRISLVVSDIDLFAKVVWYKQL